MQKKKNNYIKIYIYNLCRKEAKTNNKVIYSLHQLFGRKNKKRKENIEHSGSGALLAVPVPHGSQQLGAQQLPDVKEKRVKN